MIRSLISYSSIFLKIISSKEKTTYLRNERSKQKNLSNLVQSIDLYSKKKALDTAIDWLLIAQKNMSDDGIGSFHLSKGWGTSYPETTGYIIPTLFNYSNQSEIKTKALKAADWLISIQKESGGWQSMRMADDRPEIVFNTGQALRGMIAAYQESNEDKYLESAIKSADWLCEIQNEKGFWDKHVFMDVARVYDSYVSAPLLDLWKITKEKKYTISAEKNISWVINAQQNKNGSFNNCDNTIKHNQRPILHTICYTIDGILDAGITLNNQIFIGAAIKPSDKLLEIFKSNNFLSMHGRYDTKWNGSESLITTGCAQLSIIWLKLFALTKESKYLEAASKLNSLLVVIQQRHEAESENTKGALFGSFPFWGRYENFAFPNWATKYLADALQMELACSK